VLVRAPQEAELITDRDIAGIELLVGQRPQQLLFDKSDSLAELVDQLFGEGLRFVLSDSCVDVDSNAELLERECRQRLAIPKADVERGLISARQVDGAAGFEQDKPVEARERHASRLHRDASKRRFAEVWTGGRPEVTQDEPQALA